MAPRDALDSLTWGVLILAIVVVAIVWTLTGCTPSPCVKPVVSLEEPVLPTVSATDMACLTDKTWDALWQRDLVLQSRLRECREVVKELTETP